MTQKLSSYFSDYHEYHRTAGNQFCHYIGVPTIVVTLLGMLSMVTFGSAEMQTWLFRPDLGMALLLFGIGFYFYVDWKIAVPFTLVLFGMYFLGRSIQNFWVLLAIHAGGWVVQYIGHLHYEKKSPAFYKNLTHLFVGPIWVFSKIVGYAKT